MASTSERGSSSESGDEADETSIKIVEVATKYRIAAQVTNLVLKNIAAKCQVNASVRELCESGDQMIVEESLKSHKKVKNKGIAFPTCISVNNYIAHFSPLKDQPDIILKAGDLVKIDLGSHFEGFIAVAATSLVVQDENGGPVTGKAADVVCAAYNGIEAMKRLVRPGTVNMKITEIVKRIAKEFECTPVEGMLSHQMDKDVIDGEKFIIQNPTEEQRKNSEKKIDEFEVWAIDCIITKGSGKAKKGESKTNLFKKTENSYQLKMKTSRAFLSEVMKKFETMTFNLRNFEDEKKARMGLVECCKHDVIEGFDVYEDKDGAIVAQFKSTILVFPSHTDIITELPINIEDYQSSHSIEDAELKDLLSQPVAVKKKTAKKKGGAGGDKAAKPTT